MNFFSLVSFLLFYFTPDKNQVCTSFFYVFIYKLIIYKVIQSNLFINKRKKFKKNKHNQYYHIKREAFKFYDKIRRNRKWSYKFKENYVIYHGSFYKMNRKNYFEKKKFKFECNKRSNKKKNNTAKTKVELDSTKNGFDYSNEKISNINIYKYDATENVSDNETIEKLRICHCGSTEHSRITSKECKYFGIPLDDVKRIVAQLKQELCLCGSNDHSRITSKNCKYYGLSLEEVKKILSKENQKLIDNELFVINKNSTNKRLRTTNEITQSNDTSIINIEQPLSTPKRPRNINSSSNKVNIFNINFFLKVS